MSENDAKQVIKQAIAIAQKAGAYTLKDSALIYNALVVLGMDNNEPQRNDAEENQTETRETK